MDSLPICPQYTFAHARMAGEIGNRDAFQPQSPRSQQVKAAVPRKIVNPGRGFEKNDGLSFWLRCALRHLSCHGGNLQVIEPADETALDALCAKLGEAGKHWRIILDGAEDETLEL